LFCTSCGKELSAQWNYCRDCGAAVEQDSSPSVKQNSPPSLGNTSVMASQITLQPQPVDAQSRQTAYQHRQIAKGLCKLCSKKLYKSGLCAEHYTRHLELNRISSRKRAAKKKSNICKLCPKKLYKSGLCAEHYTRHLELNKITYRKRKAEKKSSNSK
jgi:hypothetical protein